MNCQTLCLSSSFIVPRSSFLSAAAAAEEQADEEAGRGGDRQVASSGGRYERVDHHIVCPPSGLSSIVSARPDRAARSERADGRGPGPPAPAAGPRGRPALVVPFGGATLGQSQEGCWLDAGRRVCREPIRPVVVSFMPERLDEFRQALHDVGKRLGQEAMYVRFEEPRVELVRVDAAPHGRTPAPGESRKNAR